MSKPDNIVKLLIVDPSLEDAEQIISILRNGGLAVRPCRAASLDEIDKLLAEQPLDMLLAKLGLPELSVSNLVDAVARRGKDLPVLVYGPELDPRNELAALQAGAAAVVRQGLAEHLQLTVKRELANVQARRAVRRLEASLRESEKRCNALLASSRDAIAYVHEGMHVYANPAYLELLGFDDAEDVEGLSILDVVDGRHAEELKAILRQIRKGEKPPKSIEVRAQTMTGGQFDATMEFSEASVEGEPCTQIILRQKLADAALASELEELRNRDLVTGLYNRTFLVNELENAVTEALDGRQNQCLVFVEIDNLDKLLGTIGIGHTDLLIGDVAALLRDYAGEQAIAARYAEHSFCLLYRALDHDAAPAVVEDLLKRFEEHIFEVGKHSLNLTVSAALVLIGEKSGSPQEVLDHGLTTCRSAAEEGGNRMHVYDPAARDKAEAAKDAHWLHLIKDALAKDGFVLFSQPIISLHGAEGDYFEILLRMQGPKGEISPAHFMPVAERHHLLGAIDRWVIAKTIRMLAEREKTGNRATCFVKISPQSLEDGTLVPWLAQQLKQHRLRGDALVFEMPESKVVTSMKPVRHFQKGIEQLHCAFAIEQFGSGLNSFQTLKHVNAAYVKIDRSFMKELSRNVDNQHKVKEICEQAHALGKLTVAEHVEDAASMSLLFGWGVNFVQGNFLQEPEKIMQYDSPRG